MNEEITLRDVADYLDRIGIQFMATMGHSVNNIKLAN